MIQQTCFYFEEGEPQVELNLISKPQELDYAKEITRKYHGYKPTFSWVGRQLNWLITTEKGPCGVIGIGSPGGLNFSKSLWKYIGVNGNSCTKFLNLNYIADNWRFTLCPWAGKNVGTQALSILNHVARKTYKEVYGDQLCLLITFVEQPRQGTVYRAASWDFVGESGTGKFNKKLSYGVEKCRTKAAYFDKEGSASPKLIFAKPLHPYWRKAILKNTTVGGKPTTLNPLEMKK